MLLDSVLCSFLFVVQIKEGCDHCLSVKNEYAQLVVSHGTVVQKEGVIGTSKSILSLLLLVHVNF